MQIGVRQVIAGWDLGILGDDNIPAMKVRYPDNVGGTQILDNRQCPPPVLAVAVKAAHFLPLWSEQ